MCYASQEDTPTWMDRTLASSAVQATSQTLQQPPHANPVQQGPTWIPMDLHTAFPVHQAHFRTWWLLLLRWLASSAMPCMQSIQCVQKSWDWSVSLSCLFFCGCLSFLLFYFFAGSRASAAVLHKPTNHARSSQGHPCVTVSPFHRLAPGEPYYDRSLHCDCDSVVPCLVHVSKFML